MAELNDHTYEQITALCKQGDELADAEALCRSHRTQALS